MKFIKFFWLSLSFVIILASCNFPDGSNQPTRSVDQTSTATIAHVDPVSTQTPAFTPIIAITMMTASLTSMPLVPNTPIWSAYDYTCELAAGGSTMTMNLAWFDRSDSEEGYNIYRDGKVIATLAPNSTFYRDVSFVALGNQLRHTVEAFSADWKASTSTISNGCQ